MSNGVAALVLQQDALAEILQQHLVEAAELHDRAVIALHELFDGQVRIVALVAEPSRQCALMVEQETVLATAGQQVQRKADAPQVLLPFVQGVVFLLGEESMLHQLAQAVGAKMSLCDPVDHLDVAQPSRGALDVGLQLVGGVVVASVALRLFFHLGAEEFGA